MLVRRQLVDNVWHISPWSKRHASELGTHTLPFGHVVAAGIAAGVIPLPLDCRVVNVLVVAASDDA